jgi:hypothetical protein
MAGDEDNPIRTALTASTSVIKAGIALGLMAIFFICFFLAPGLTAAGALLIVIVIELLRRR